MTKLLYSVSLFALVGLSACKPAHEAAWPPGQCVGEKDRTTEHAQGLDRREVTTETIDAERRPLETITWADESRQMPVFRSWWAYDGDNVVLEGHWSGHDGNEEVTLIERTFDALGRLELTVQESSDRENYFEERTYVGDSPDPTEVLQFADEEATEPSKTKFYEYEDGRVVRAVIDPPESMINEIKWTYDGPAPGRDHLEEAYEGLDRRLETQRRFDASGNHLMVAHQDLLRPGNNYTISYNYDDQGRHVGGHVEYDDPVRFSSTEVFWNDLNQRTRVYSVFWEVPDGAPVGTSEASYEYDDVGLPVLEREVSTIEAGGYAIEAVWSWDCDGS